MSMWAYLLTGKHAHQTSTHLFKVQKMFVKCVRKSQKLMEGETEMTAQHCYWRKLRRSSGSCSVTCTWSSANPGPCRRDSQNICGGMHHICY